MAQTQVRLPDVLMERITTASKKASMSKNDIIKLALEAGLKWLAEKDYDLTKSTETELLVEELKAILATHTADLERAKKVTYDRLAGSHDPSLKSASATAAECGHSETVLFKHYREVVTAEAATEFWSTSLVL